MSKPYIPKGTRDFAPQTMARRQWMFDTLRSVFESHGFDPIQTPSFENLSTLTGKYGEEGDQLIFKILNNGDFLAKADEGAMANKDSKALATSICKKALRYDLTVPFARFVVMHRNELTFPFRRYQIQPVWRGDRPGKGRYQEFTQCDCDIIGTESTLSELTLIQVYDEALGALRVPGYRIVLNDRRVLMGLAQACGVPEEQFTDWTVAVDKFDKLGLEGVRREFEQRQILGEAGEGLVELLRIRSLDTHEARLAAMESMVSGQPEAMAAIDSLRVLIEQALNLGVGVDSLRVDPLLARGLDYYTGAIFEVVVDDAPVGSICGGGRYDDLTGIFGWSGMSGVGISFGADRIEDVLNHFEAWPDMVGQGLDVLVVQLEGGDLGQELSVAQTLRGLGLRVEHYPEAAKLKKQFKFANDRRARYVVVLGQEELSAGKVGLKDMKEGGQRVISLEEAMELLRPTTL